MLYSPSAFVSQAETLTLALAGSFLISVCIGTILDVSQAISPNDELLILLQYFFFLIKSSRCLGTRSWSNAFASHLIRPPAIWESPFHWRGGGAFYPIPQSHFCSERNVPFLDASRTCTYTDTFSQMVSTLLFFYSPRLRSCIFTSYKFFLFVLPGLLWFMTTRRENEQWGQTKWILAVQTCRIELSSGLIAHWNICLHFSRQTKMLSELLSFLRIDSNLHLYSHICTIRLADFER